MSPSGTSSGLQMAPIISQSLKSPDRNAIMLSTLFNLPSNPAFNLGQFALDVGVNALP